MALVVDLVAPNISSAFPARAEEGTPAEAGSQANPASLPGFIPNIKERMRALVAEIESWPTSTNANKQLATKVGGVLARMDSRMWIADNPDQILKDAAESLRASLIWQSSPESSRADSALRDRVLEIIGELEAYRSHFKQPSRP
jgi:hypothetical protein